MWRGKSKSRQEGPWLERRIVFEPNNSLSTVTPSADGSAVELEWSDLSDEDLRSLPAECVGTVHAIDKAVQGAIALVSSSRGEFARKISIASSYGEMKVTIVLMPSVEDGSKRGGKRVMGILKSIRERSVQRDGRA